MKKRDYLNISFLIGFIFIFVSVLLYKGYLFGSNIDWVSQHIVFPDYFREVFYKTGEIIPKFNMNLGMGQNIFYFTYYGLFSPWILLSYAFPFISMSSFIQIISIISVILTLILLYKWLLNNFNSKTAFISSILFMLSGPLLFQAHRHIMFIIYLPFLISSFILIDKYFISKKKVFYIISVFLLIMSSFYYSVFSIISLGIYTIYKILKENKSISIKSFKPLGMVIFYTSIGILLASFILFPTFYALFKGRGFNLENINLFKLMLPSLSIKSTFYYSYSMGFTFIYFISIVYLFLKRKKEDLFLGIILLLCLLFPFISYIFNFFMYADGKGFIPFIFLGVFAIGEFLDDLLNKKVDINNLLKYLVISSLVIILISIKERFYYLFLLDIFISLFFLFLIRKNKKSYLFIIPVIIISFCSFIMLNLDEKFVKKSDINYSDYKHLASYMDRNDRYRLVSNVNLLNDVNKVYSMNHYSSSIYSSSSNKNYLNFVRNIFKNEVYNKDYSTITSSSNVLFNIYASEKYLITDKDAPAGYNEVLNKNNLTLYENKDVLPTGYASSKVMSLREFNTLSYPYNVDALLNYIVVDKSHDNVYKSNIKEIDLSFDITNYKNIDINDDGHLNIKSKDNGYLNLSLNNPTENKVLLISFDMNKEKDGSFCSTEITINGITNSLSCSKWKYHNQNYTFEYVLSSNEVIDSLDINFSKGEYDLSNFKFYTLSYDSIKDIKVDPLNINNIKSTSNSIYGDIDVSEDGFFTISIPYEKKGFKVYLDNYQIPFNKTDDAFIGFEIPKGRHVIYIVYEPPYLKEGIIFSQIGLALLFICIIYNKIKWIFDYLKKQLYKLFSYVKDFIVNFSKINYGYIFMFVSLYLMDISIRFAFYKSALFYKPFKLVPNLFSIIWILFFLFLTKFFKKKSGRVIYLTFYIVSLIFFLVHSYYFIYFDTFFDFEVLRLAGEGTSYIFSVLLNVKWWMIIVSIISIYLTVKGLKSIKHSEKVNYFKVIILVILFIFIKGMIPLLLGKVSDYVSWDDWRNPRSVYSSYNDSNKSFMVSGLFEYNIRNFYVNYIKDKETLTEYEKKVLDKNFKEKIKAKENEYTGIFEGKNLILVQLESVDEFLITKEVMPVTYGLMKNSINFKNHYSFTSGGGSTFNSEFMVNTGYSSAYNYHQSAYAFSRNNYDYSLPNLLRKKGYSSNAFHMNTGEYYSRTINYKAFGYDKYYGLKDLNEYEKNEYTLDRELINNKLFYENIFKDKAVSYIITYSAHMPFSSDKGVCSLLTDKEALTEYECLKIQAGETDYFMKLLLEGLEENNMIDNTVLVVFADHYLYTLEDKELLDQFKKTDSNLINHTPFFIWSNGEYKKTVNTLNSQLDILPTLLNLFNINYYENYYIGRDIFSDNYEGLVFFPDGSWWNGKTYVDSGEYLFGSKISDEKIHEINDLVMEKMTINDATLKSNYFSNVK